LFEELRPGHCTLFARWLGHSVERITEFGVRVHRASRLPLAQTLLLRTAAAEKFPSTERELIRIGNALLTAWDFRLITHALPPTGLPSLAEDLRRSIGGSLDDLEPTAAHRAQSQLAFGAVLVAGGLRPLAPDTSGGPSPDYVVSVDTLPIGVEVKRPMRIANLTAAVDEAARQLTGFGSRHWAVHVDLSDAVRHELLDGLHQGLRPDLGRLFAIASDEVSDHIFAARDRFRFMVGYMSARVFAWDLTDEPRFIPFASFRIEAYPEACGGLVVTQARRLRDAIRRGGEERGMVERNVRRS
jgi:hypothetical protein